MSNRQQPTRRQLLALTGSLAVVGLAGCSGSGDGSNDGAASDSTSTPTPAHEDDSHGEEGGDDHHEQTEDDHHQETEEAHHEETEETHHEETEGDDHGHNHDQGTPEEPSQAAEVTLRTEGNQQHFDPHIAWVEPGGTVTWELESGTHDAVAYHPDNDDKPLRMPEDATPWRTDLLSEQGATASHTFETEGVYDYYCTPHESLGMVGTVIVGEPDAHDQPALEEPQNSLPEGARAELATLGDKVNEALGHTH
jgi:plastocyanin